MKDSFVFYKSFFEAIEKLPEECQLEAYRSITKLALFGEDEEPTGLASIVYIMAKPQIEANFEKYENGRKGGAPKGNKNAKRKQPMVELENNQKQPVVDLVVSEKQPPVEFKNNKKQPNVNVNVNDNVISSNEDKAKSVSRFVAPTLAEIQEYCKEKGFNVDAASIYDHYTANGWVQGKNKPIKDWKAAVRQWARREGEFSKPQPQINNDARRGGFDDVSHNSGDDYEGMF